MPVTYSVLGGGSLIVERWVGSITRAELIDQARALARDDEVKPGSVKFSDFRAARLGEVTLAMLEELGGVRTRRHVRTAVLVHDANWAQARAAEVQVEHPGLEVACFNLLGAGPGEEVATACQWLGVAPDLVESALARLASS
jgi:hypothetical protein